MKSLAIVGRTLLVAATLALVAASAQSASGGNPSSSGGSGAVRFPPIPTIRCDCPTSISLVGSMSGVTDPAGNFTVRIYDLNNLPIYGSLVVVDFSACSGVTLCQNQPGLTVDCGSQTVRGFTGWTGITMAIAGHGNNWMGNQPPFSPPGCARIFADGVLVASKVGVSMYDQDGSGMGGGDLNAFLGDFFGNQPPRSDYDGDGSLTGADLSLWLSVFFAAGSPSNCPGVSPQCTMVP